MNSDWWKTACVYQIYPRSFFSSKGQPVGDLNGVTAKARYLSSLGIDAVWLTPFFPSSLYDGGYDIDDYMNVDPRLGTIKDFERMVDVLHTFNIKVYVDIVPNHTSIHHKWFEEALLAQPNSPERNRYIFRDGQGKDGELPPNDWPSHFGDKAWTRIVEPDGKLGQWYYHMFAPEQPDLNWQNEEVRKYFEEVIKFWADKGADGFRVDVAHAMSKDLSEPFKSKPTILPMLEDDPIFDREDNHKIFSEWRKIFNTYNPPLSGVAEANVQDPAKRVLYARSTELGQAFNFDLLKSSWDAKQMYQVIDTNIQLAKEYDTAPTWVLSNHDKVRHLTRYSLPNDTDYKEWLMTDGKNPEPNYKLGKRRAKAATMMMMALHGSVYIYQGEELGLPEVADIPRNKLQDPVWKQSEHKFKGRDGCRIPLPWNYSQNFGFTTAEPHLPMPEWFKKYTIAKQQINPKSFLNFYRNIIKIRKTLNFDTIFEWIENADNNVLHFRRKQDWYNITNMNNISIPMPAHKKIIYSSRTIKNNMIPANTTVWYSL